MRAQKVRKRSALKEEGFKYYFLALMDQHLQSLAPFSQVSKEIN